MRLAPLASVAVGAVLVFTGCRTYGSHDATEHTRAALSAAVEDLDQALPRMTGEQQELARLAGSDSLLTGVSRDYERLVAEGRTLLTQQQAEAAELAESSDFRRVQAALGATLTAQQQFADRYLGLMMRAAGTPDTTSYLRMADRSAGYMTVPPFYFHTANANRVPSLVAAARAPRPVATPAPAAADTVRIAPAPTAPAATAGEDTLATR